MKNILKSCLFKIVVIYCIITLTLISIYIFSSFDKRRIQPDSGYVIEKSLCESITSYHFTSKNESYQSYEPRFVAREPISGIYQSGDDLYMEIGREEYYYINLPAGIPKRIETLPKHVKLIDPKNFWENLPRF